MTTFSLKEASEKTGRSETILRKHIERGKLRATKEGNRSVIDSKDLDAYMTSEELSATAVAVLTSSDVPREVGNMIARLPRPVAEAILMGMPTSKKALGSPELFDRATRSLTRNRPSMQDNDDPHFGYPVGYQHTEAPRWKRTSNTTWSLEGAKWSWNGIEWEGGGSRDGQSLGEGITPAHPASDRRPTPPPKAVVK